MRNKIFLAIILLFALLVRIVAISKYPIGFTQDEAAQGYDAYSILLTGKDMWGKSLPLTLRSFGDFKLPLYTYLTVPSVFIFGLNEFAVRFPSAAFGTLAVLATYFMVYELTKRKDVALISALFLAASPWHISLSRGAFEAGLTTFFIPLGVWGFLKGLEDSKWMVLSATTFGLNMFSYHSARFFTPLILLLLILLNRKELTRNLTSGESIFSKYKYSIVVFGTFLLTVFYTMFIGANSRGLDITIFNPTDNWAAMSHRRYEAIVQGVPAQIARLFSNKVTFTVKTFASNYLTYLTPEFLFTKGVSLWSYGMIPGRGVLYFFEIVFIVASLYSIAKRDFLKGANFILIWILLSPLPAALTKGGGYSGTRAATMIPAIQIFSAFGFIYLLDKLVNVKFKLYRKMFLISFYFVFLLSVVFFLEDYFIHAPREAAKAMSYGTVQVVDFVNEVSDKYSEILVSRSLSVPHIWFTFFNKIKPVDVQEASKDWLRYEKEGYVSIDQLDKYQLGEYVFGDVYYDRRKNDKGTLFVGRPEDFSEKVTPLKTIFYPNGEVAFIFVESLIQ